MGFNADVSKNYLPLPVFVQSIAWQINVHLPTCGDGGEDITGLPPVSAITEVIISLMVYGFGSSLSTRIAVLTMANAAASPFFIHHRANPFSPRMVG